MAPPPVNEDLGQELDAPAYCAKSPEDVCCYWNIHISSGNSLNCEDSGRTCGGGTRKERVLRRDWGGEAERGSEDLLFAVELTNHRWGGSEIM